MAQELKEKGDLFSFLVALSPRSMRRTPTKMDGE
jgi:hypothetical protein